MLPLLTTREHLDFYARIKGIPEFDNEGKPLRDMLIKQKINEMDLKKFENVLSGTYSGGNKRKLSVAIALLGNP